MKQLLTEAKESRNQLVAGREPVIQIDLDSKNNRIENYNDIMGEQIIELDSDMRSENFTTIEKKSI